MLVVLSQHTHPAVLASWLDTGNWIAVASTGVYAGAANRIVCASTGVAECTVLSADWGARFLSGPFLDPESAVGFQAF